MEIWDIYDKYRRKKIYTHERGKAMKPGDYHIVVHVWIVNSKGEVLIQKRQAGKKGWPGMWDCAAAGSAIISDSSRDAAVRETFEEIGLYIDKDNLEPLFTVRFAKGFDDNWLIRREVDIERLVLQEEEVKAVKWVKIEDILDMVNREEFIPFPFLDRLFELVNSNIIIKKTKLKDKKVSRPSGYLVTEDYYDVFLKEKLIGNILVSDNQLGIVEIRHIKRSRKFLKEEIYEEIISRLEILYPQAEQFKIFSDGEVHSSVYKKNGYTILENSENPEDKVGRVYIKKDIYRMPDIKDLKNR